MHRNNFSHYLYIKKFFIILTFIMPLTTRIHATDELMEPTTKKHKSCKYQELSSINFVPQEIKLIIYSFLTTQDVVRLMKTSNSFYSAADNKDLWKYQFERLPLTEPFNPFEKGMSWKQGVVTHYVCKNIFVNLLRGNSQTFYPIARSLSFTQEITKYINFLINAYALPGSVLTQPEAKQLNNLFVEHSCESAIHRKIEGLKEGRYGYLKDMEALRKFNEQLTFQGNKEARKRKYEGLERGSYGYSKNKDDLRAFNEELIAQGDTKAINKKLEGLKYGQYGYEQDPEALREFNDKLIQEGNVEAIQRKFEGLERGRNGYQKDNLKLQEFIEELVFKGNDKAIYRKINNLLAVNGGSFGGFGKAQAQPPAENLVLARELNEQLVAKRNLEAIKRKINGLTPSNLGGYVPYLYEHNTEESRNFIEQLIAENPQEFAHYKFEGLEQGKWGYTKDIKALREFNKQLLDQGNVWAINRKIEGLAREVNGYRRDLDASRQLNEEQVQKGNIEAIDRKIRGLTHGTFGYEENHQEAKALNEFLKLKGHSCRDISFTDEGRFRNLTYSILLRKFNEERLLFNHSQAIETKIEGLATGFHGYKRDSKQAYQLNEDLVKQGDQAAFQRKIEGLGLGKYGYKPNIQQAHELNEQLVGQGDQKAIERKIEGLATGFYGYQRSPEAARELNELEIGKGCENAIERKIIGFFKSKYGYEGGIKSAKEFNEALIAQGNRKAIYRKIRSLTSMLYMDTNVAEHKRLLHSCYANDLIYNYEQNEAIIKELLESLIAQGDKKAIYLKLKIFIDNFRDYSNGETEEINALLESLVRQGDLKAINLKIKQLSKRAARNSLRKINTSNTGFTFNGGNPGFAFGARSVSSTEFTFNPNNTDNARKNSPFQLPSNTSAEFLNQEKSQINSTNCEKDDLKAAFHLNESLVSQGNIQAIHRKIQGLLGGSYGYEKDIDQAVVLNELLVQRNNKKAIQYKLERLREFCGQQTKTPSWYKTYFNDQLIEQGDREALFLKMEGLKKGWYGYPKTDLSLMRNFIEKLVEQKHEGAFYFKLKGLTKGKYGYPVNKQEAKNFNDALISQGNKEAIKRKTLELLERGSMGGIEVYRTARRAANPSEMLAFNEELVLKGNLKAIERKVEGLAEGHYGYQKTPQAARKYNEELVEQGDTQALKRKNEGLLYGKYGYSLDIHALKLLNDKLVLQHNTNALIQKALGLSYGMYGYEINTVKAIKFIQKYEVHPFSYEILFNYNKEIIFYITSLK